jgi:hypothetical protein
MTNHFAAEEATQLCVCVQIFGINTKHLSEGML